MACSRLISACLAAAVLFLVSAPGTAEAQSAARASPTHVYLFRGFMGMFSLGMDTIAEQLNRRGILATAHAHTTWTSMAESAKQDYRSGRLRNIILMGHSLGGPAAIEMARELAAARIPVALIVTFDPVGSGVVPANVRRAINLYISGGMGTKLTPGERFRGSLQNLDQRGQGHVAIQYSQSLQQRAIGYVLSTVGRTGSASARPAPPRGSQQAAH